MIEQCKHNRVDFIQNLSYFQNYFKDTGILELSIIAEDWKLNYLVVSALRTSITSPNISYICIFNVKWSLLFVWWSQKIFFNMSINSSRTASETIKVAAWDYCFKSSVPRNWFHQQPKKKIEATMKISSQEIFTYTTISYCTDQLIQMTYCWQAEFA